MNRGLIHWYHPVCWVKVPNLSFIAVTSHRITSYHRSRTYRNIHNLSYHIIIYHHISWHIMSCHKSYRIVSYRVISHRIVSYYTTPHHTTSHHITLHHITSHHIISYHRFLSNIHNFLMSSKSGLFTRTSIDRMLIHFESLIFVTGTQRLKKHLPFRVLNSVDIKRFSFALNAVALSHQCLHL